MITRAIKFRLYPTKEQEEYFGKCFRTADFIFNYFLKEQKDIDDTLIMYGLTNKEERFNYKTKHKLWFNDYDANAHLTIISKIENYKFLTDVSSSIRNYSTKFLKTAFSNIRKTEAGFPNFKNKNSKKSFTGQIQYNGENKYPKTLKILGDNKWCYITLPLIGDIKTVVHKDEFKVNYNDRTKFKFNSYTVSKTSNGKYYISLQLDDYTVNKKPIKPITEETTIGIDMGVVRPITTSDEKDFNNELYSKRFDLLKVEKDKLEKLSKILSKKILKNPNWKESKKYHRLRKKLNTIHNNITNKRDNLQHNITRELVNKSNTNTFIVEDLKIKNMTKRSAKGKSKQKRHLSKAILDVGMYSIYSKLAYKADWEGKNVERISAQYTSQKCSECGHIHKESRISQSIYSCINCGKEQNADLNGAKNVKDKFFNK